MATLEVKSEHHAGFTPDFFKTMIAGPGQEAPVKTKPKRRSKTKKQQSNGQPRPQQQTQQTQQTQHQQQQQQQTGGGKKKKRSKKPSPKASPKRSGGAPDTTKYAGSQYQTAPDPSSLPLPSFAMPMAGPPMAGPPMAGPPMAGPAADNPLAKLFAAAALAPAPGHNPTAPPPSHQQDLGGMSTDLRRMLNITA